MTWVIQKTEPAARPYVAPAGFASSYVSALQHARTFPTQAAAQRECCGNEMPVRREDCLRG